MSGSVPKADSHIDQGNSPGAQLPKHKPNNEKPEDHTKELGTGSDGFGGVEDDINHAICLWDGTLLFLLAFLLVCARLLFLL